MLLAKNPPSILFLLILSNFPLNRST
jgi:hypothetical protein